MSKNDTNKGSAGLLQVLLVVFIVMKLIPGNVVHDSWSWWWVLSPIWLPLAVVLALILIFKFYVFCMTFGRKD